MPITTKIKAKVNQINESFLKANAPNRKVAIATAKNGIFLKFIIFKYKWYKFITV